MSEVGIFEAAYHVVKELLMAEEDSKRLESHMLKDSYLYPFINQHARPMSMGIHRDMNNVKLHFLDPVEYIISNARVTWGMVSYAKRYDHVFGTVFRYQHPSKEGLEYICGLLMDPSKIHMIYSPCNDRSKTWTLTAPFVKEGINELLDAHASDSCVAGIFADYPGIYDMSASLVELVHDVLTGDMPYTPPEMRI